MTQIQLIDKSLVSKKGVENLAENILQALDNGTVNPLELKAAFKAIEKVAEVIKSKLDEQAVTEASKYDGKTFSFGGNQIELSDSLGVKYDYSNCGHLEYNVLSEEVKKRTERMKQIEKELQSMKASRTEVNTETGEVYTVYPPIKKSTTGVKITLK